MSWHAECADPASAVAAHPGRAARLRLTVERADGRVITAIDVFPRDCASLSLLLQPLGALLCVCIEQAPLRMPFVVFDATAPARRLDHGVLTLPPPAVVTSAVIELGEQGFATLSVSA